MINKFGPIFDNSIKCHERFPRPGNKFGEVSINKSVIIRFSSLNDVRFGFFFKASTDPINWWSFLGNRKSVRIQKACRITEVHRSAVLGYIIQDQSYIDRSRCSFLHTLLWRSTFCKNSRIHLFCRQIIRVLGNVPWWLFSEEFSLSRKNRD
jgi:hypothetical protein